MNNITFYLTNSKTATITNTDMGMDELGKCLSTEFLHFTEQGLIINTKNITMIECKPVDGIPPRVL